MFEPERKHAVIVGINGTSLELAKLFTENGLDVELYYDTEEELGLIEKSGLKNVYTYNRKKDKSKFYHTYVEIFVAATNNSDDNDSLMKKAEKIGVPLRVSTTPSEYANGVIPLTLGSGRSRLAVSDKQGFVYVEELIRNELRKVFRDEKFKMYDGLADILERLDEDVPHYERVIESLSSDAFSNATEGNVEELLEQLQRMLPEDEEEREIVIGFGGYDTETSDHLRRAQELTERLADVEPDYRFRIDWCSGSENVSYKDKFKVLTVKETNLYRAMTEKLLSKEIDIAIINPFFLYASNFQNSVSTVKNGLEIVEGILPREDYSFVVFSSDEIDSINEVVQMDKVYFPDSLTELLFRKGLTEDMAGSTTSDDLFNYKVLFKKDTFGPGTCAVVLQKDLDFNYQYQTKQLDMMDLFRTRFSLPLPVGYGVYAALYRSDDNKVKALLNRIRSRHSELGSEGKRDLEEYELEKTAYLSFIGNGNTKRNDEFLVRVDSVSGDPSAALFMKRAKKAKLIHRTLNREKPFEDIRNAVEELVKGF